MDKKITLKIKKTVMALAFLFITSLSYSQLAAGDIAFVGINADPTPNELSILTLNAIASGQTIIFTDYAWNGSSLDTSNSLAEGYITWTTDKIVPAGTVIKFTIDAGHTIAGGLSAYGTVSASGWSGDAIASGGDNWFILQGSIASPTFIYAYANWSTAAYGVKKWLTTGSTNATVSYLPSSLSNGTTANIQSGDAIYHFDNNVYTGTKTGTKAVMLAAIANSSSWTGSESVNQDIAPGGTNFPGTNPVFTVGTPASITSQPSNSSTCTDTNTTFSITASNATGYQWQVNTGSAFVNISNGAPYSGVTTATLTISNALNTMNGYLYRCIAIGVSNATSNSATLTVKQTTAVTDTQVACDTYTWLDGKIYTASNSTATFARTNAAGCNEVVTLNLTINKSTAVTDTQVACDTYTWIDGKTYTASNSTATFARTNAAGCNEVVTLNLTINKSTAVTDTQVACDTYTWIDGKIYTASNSTATFARTNAAGCNEVVTLNLTINKSTAVTDTQVACDTYTWIDGKTYTASNSTATFARTNAAGCNEVVTLNLTINKSTAVTDTKVACDTYTWIDGKTYTASNSTATFARTNAAGCNEVVTLNLTINKSTAVTDTQVACDTYTWLDGKTYTANNSTATFTRTNAAGCNEVVTLNLTINKSTAVTDTQVACDTYTWIDGKTYTASNSTATFARTNAAGCNEVVTLNLTINKSTAVTDTQVACDTYTWIDGKTYTASNSTAIFNRTNAAGCNEVVTLNLTINKTDAPTGIATQTAMTTGTLMDLSVDGSNIKWYDSNINGTSLDLSTVVITGNTYYATQTNNGCESKTRFAVLVSATLSNPDFEQTTFSFYPNPVENLLTVKSNEQIKKITVYNSLGQNIFSKNTNASTEVVDFSNLPSGNYYVHVDFENKVKNIKIVKK